MTTRGLYVFSHSSALGDAPATQLLEMISVVSDNPTPRSIGDYSIHTPDSAELPAGISFTAL